jgi:hypothetical protein
MFSPKVKREISMKVQTILQELIDNELPEGEIQFILHVDGAERWSWANIRNDGNRDVPVPQSLVRNLSV